MTLRNYMHILTYIIIFISRASRSKMHLSANQQPRPLQLFWNFRSINFFWPKIFFPNKSIIDIIGLLVEVGCDLRIIKRRAPGIVLITTKFLHILVAGCLPYSILKRLLLVEVGCDLRIILRRVPGHIILNNPTL